MIGRRATMVSCERADADRVLPAQLGCVGGNDDVIPRDPVQHLHVVQVEVDRVGVHAVVRDLPDLRAVADIGDGRRS